MEQPFGCHLCKKMRVVSVPDWFQCDLSGHAAATQTGLFNKCQIVHHGDSILPRNTVDKYKENSFMKRIIEKVLA